MSGFRPGGRSGTADRVYFSFDNEGFLPEVIEDIAQRGAWVELADFIKRNNREAREPEIVACARHLRSKYEKVAGVGYCFGG